MPPAVYAVSGGVSKFAKARPDKTFQAIVKEAYDYAIRDIGLSFEQFAELVDGSVASYFSDHFQRQLMSGIMVQDYLGLCPKPSHRVEGGGATGGLWLFEAMLFPRPNPPAEPPRVVITGAGIVTALGVGYAPDLAGFREGRTGVRPVTRFDVSRQRTKMAAEADVAGAPPCKLAARQLGRLDHAGRLLLWAGCEAWSQSGWEPVEHLPMVLVTTAGGMALGETYFHQAVETPLRHRGQATRACYYQAQVQARSLADALGCAGPTTILSTACAAS